MVGSSSSRLRRRSSITDDDDTEIASPQVPRRSMKTLSSPISPPVRNKQPISSPTMTAELTEKPKSHLSSNNSNDTFLSTPSSCHSPVKSGTSSAIELMKARLQAERDRKQSRRKKLGDRKASSRTAINTTVYQTKNNSTDQSTGDLSPSRRSQSEPPHMQRGLSVRLREKQLALQKRGSYLNYRIESAAAMTTMTTKSLSRSLDDADKDDDDDDDDDEEGGTSEYATSPYNMGLSYEEWEEMGFVNVASRRRVKASMLPSGVGV